MSEFFARRIGGYDEHMLGEVLGCKEGYLLMAQRIPKNSKRILDLGCGTGLELDEIFKVLPSLEVVGIDMCEDMLRVLGEKHPDKSLSLISANYLSYDFGKEEFDCVVSFETMHHFLQDTKISLYKKIKRALSPGGIYIECDYMAKDDKEEKELLSQYEALREQHGIKKEELYHIDIPFSVLHQKELLLGAGFETVEEIFRLGETVMLIAK